MTAPRTAASLRSVLGVEVLAGASVALVLGLITLGRKSWWFDEAFNVSLARDEWLKYVLKAGYYEPSQAAYLMVFKVWRVFTPETEWFTRLPSVLAAAAAAAVVGVLGARLFDRRVGILAGVLLATNASAVAWSQQARTYTFAMLAAVVITVLVLNASEAEPTARRPWILYGVAGGIGIYVHFFLAFVLAAHLTLIPELVGEQRRRLREAWVVIVLASLPAAVVNVFGENHGADWIPPTSWDRTRDAVSELAGYNVLALAIAVGGVVAILTRRVPGAAPWKARMLVAWAVAPVAGALVVSILKPLVAGRYLLVAAPALAVLGGVALATIRPRVVAAAAAIVVIGVSVREIDVWYDREPQDWREAAVFAQSVERQGVTIALVPTGNYIPYQLYAPLPASCRRLPGHHEPRCNFRATGGETLVVTTVLDWRQRLPGASGYVVTKEERFGEVIRALHLQRQPQS